MKSKEAIFEALEPVIEELEQIRKKSLKELVWSALAILVGCGFLLVGLWLQIIPRPPMFIMGLIAFGIFFLWSYVAEKAIGVYEKAFGEKILGGIVQDINPQLKFHSDIPIHKSEIKEAHLITKGDNLSLIHISEPTRPY